MLRGESIKGSNWCWI